MALEQVHGKRHKEDAEMGHVHTHAHTRALSLSVQDAHSIRALVGGCTGGATRTKISGSTQTRTRCQAATRQAKRSRRTSGGAAGTGQAG
jgi:hypothetical protein